MQHILPARDPEAKPDGQTEEKCNRSSITMRPQPGHVCTTVCMSQQVNTNASVENSDRKMLN